MKAMFPHLRISCSEKNDKTCRLKMLEKSIFTQGIMIENKREASSGGDTVSHRPLKGESVKRFMAVGTSDCCCSQELRGIRG